MASLFCSLESRSFMALLRGLNKRLFQDNSDDITIEYLNRELYAGSEDGNGAAQIRSYEDLLSRAAAENWDVARLQAEAGQLGGCSAEQLRDLLAFWGSERLAIHARLVQRNTFNDQLRGVFWRVDVRVASKASGEMNEPTAVVELYTQGSHGATGSRLSAATSNNSTSVTAPTTPLTPTKGLVRFDLTRDDLSNMMRTLETINKKIEDFAN